MKGPREIPVNLPNIPVGKTPLRTRLLTHADSMQSEGWYTTANVLAEAADAVVDGALLEIQQERRRQIESEGWSIAHDDAHDSGELAQAAATYALASKKGSYWASQWRELWPWETEWFKPRDRRRDLIRAAALIVAEVERLDRASKRGPTPLPPTRPDRVQIDAREIGITLKDEGKRESPAPPSGKTFLMD